MNSVFVPLRGVDCVYEYQRMLKQELGKRSLRLSDAGIQNEANPYFDPEVLKNTLPEVFRTVQAAFEKPLRGSYVGVELLMYLLEAVGVSEERMETLRVCGRLNRGYRNDIAHQLTAVTEKQIENACDATPARLMKGIGELIEALYPECDPKLFTVYRRCGDYIRENLR